MNIYEKLANARADLKAANLKMSGENKFAGYRYYDLSDFLPTITKLEQKYKMLSVVRWSAEKATLTIYDADGEQGNYIEFESPMSTAELKGCHAVQNLGAVETYVRRYLYLAAYEIVEAEALDLTQGKPDTKVERQEPKQEPRQEAKPVEQHQEQREYDLTLKQALNLSFKKGKSANVPFAELDENSLQWAADNLQNVYGEAARMVLESRQPVQIDLSMPDTGDLPF